MIKLCHCRQLRPDTSQQHRRSLHSFDDPFLQTFFSLLLISSGSSFLPLLSCSRAPAAFNLINDIDIPETEKRLAKLRQENAAFTALNAQRDARDALSVQAEEERVWREQQERAKEARLEEEEERLEREREKKEIIDSLVSILAHCPPPYKACLLDCAIRDTYFPQQSSEGSAAKIVANKRAAQRQQHPRDQPQTASGKIKLPGVAASSRSDASTLHANEPFKPLDDNYYSHSDRFILSSSVPVPGLGLPANGGGSSGYGDPGTDALLRDTGADVLRAGGYRLSEAQERAIRTGIAGLSLSLVVKD